MPLSVPSSSNGNGLAGLLRQARQAKADEPSAPAASDPSTTVSVRPIGRSGIDSTQRGTAQISAALTVYLSKLGGTDDAAASQPTAMKAAAASVARDGAAAGSNPSGSAQVRSSAADLLRTLDRYRGQASGLRLTA